jgi:RimJ/RimL family protein N-acetyltransferase
MSNPIRPERDLSLRDVQESDLDIFFAYRQDPPAVHMAAFTAKDPTDRAAFDAHWQRIRADPDNTNRTILLNETVVGHIASFVMSGNLEVTYWIDRAYWGQGLATRALNQFLAVHQRKRPIYGRAAKDNLGSIRVLEKCGFEKVGEDRGFANARGEEIAEVIMKLEH